MAKFTIRYLASLVPGIFAVALLLLLPSVSGAVAVHTFDCKQCHIPSLSVSQLGGGNVCLQCHDETIGPTNSLLSDGAVALVTSAFSPFDASNALGNNPTYYNASGLGQTSHNWGAPDTQPRAGAVAPAPAQFYSRYGSSTGKVTCTRCHNPHATRDNPQLLVLGAGSTEAMCVACHAPFNKGESTDKTGNNTTHPVGIAYPYPAGNAAYKPSPGNTDGNINTDDGVELYAGKIVCGTCHQVHFADSSAATADTPGNFAALSNGGGDGKLLRGDGGKRADKSGFCQTCHTYQVHGDMSGEKVGCLVCHGGHSYDPVAPNYFMLRKTATTTTYNTVDGLNYSSADVLDPGNKYRAWNDRNTGTNNGYCERCHGDAQSIPGGGGAHTTNANCTQCHGHNRSDQGSFVANCIGCHAEVQGSRAAVTGQFSGNSHHVQGPALTNQHCYQCHWEADSSGKTTAYHSGSPGAAVDLVIYGAGTRPAAYASGTTVIQYTANGSRTEITKLNQHCLSCHSDSNNATTPFGDGKTPKQYAWDNTSIAARYSQSGIIPWGKYVDTASNNISPKNTQNKAYSAHGNAIANQGGWDLNETWPNTRNGTINVTCYDCHNSHGSNITGKTTSYEDKPGYPLVNGGLLKETNSGTGGYTASYKPVGGGAEGTNNVRNAGASLCFDCHLNAASSASKPWGYQSTFDASQPIIGYYDTPDLAPGNAGPEQRYPYKGIPDFKGGHFGASLPMDILPSEDNRIGGLCTPCHDPHGVSPTLGANQEYGVPLLKGTWLTSPYKEDVSPETNSAGTDAASYLHIDGNTFSTNINILASITQTDSQFAGLCLRCHPRTSLTDGVTHTWKSRERIHESVKGWDTTTVPPRATKHNFPCSKCHTPHIGSSLPRLMVTNCLDSTHKGRTGGIPNPTVTGSGVFEYSVGPGSGRIPNNSACHEALNNYNLGATDQSWNLVTPWYDEPATLAITSGPTVTTARVGTTGNNFNVNFKWGTNILSTTLVDYGLTSSYGSTLSGNPWVNSHDVTLLNQPNHKIYHYRVRSTSYGGQNVTSADQVISISYPPSVPVLTHEDNTYCPSGCPVTLAWTASTDPDGGPIEYAVVVDDDPGFTSIDASSGWRAATTWDTPQLGTDKIWYWKVKARDSYYDVSSAFSAADSFHITAVAPPPAPAVIPHGSIDSGCSDTLVTVSWNPVSSPDGHAVEYFVQTDKYGNSGVWLQTTSWSFTLNAGDSVNWKVKARDAVHTASESGWSATDTFNDLGSGCSCPMLYTWDGSKFAFEADLYGGGKLGLKDASGYIEPDPYDFYVLQHQPIPGPEGTYDFRLVEERSEVDYLDKVKLYTVDFAAGKEVYSEVPASGAAFVDHPEAILHTVAEVPNRPRSIVHVNTGREVSDLLANADNNLLVLNEDKNLFEWQTLEIDFGDLINPQMIKLLIDGNSVFPTSPEGVARARAIVASPERTILQVLDASGNWVSVPRGIAVLPKPMEIRRPYLVNLTNVIPAAPFKVRLSFLFKTNIDLIAFDTTADDPLTISDVPLAAAELIYYGASARTSPDDIFEYIYGMKVPRDYKFMPGSYTRFGDVAPLLTLSDDKFAIFRGGDEIQFKFSSTGPPLAGSTRRFLFYTNGYYKNFKKSTVIQRTVEPLPFADMSNFPYDEAVEHYPDDTEHTQYRFEYNTRIYSE